MLLTAEPTLLLVAALWLPALAVLGAAVSAIAWRAGRRGGGRALVAAWLGTTLAAAVAFAAFLYVRATAWGPRPGFELALGTAAVAALPLGVCLGAATLVVRRQLAASGAAAGGSLLAGAAAATGAWLACAALAVVALRAVR